VTLRVEARVKPGYAWSYRVLDSERWYMVVQARSTEHAVVLETSDGERVVDAGHVELRSLLD